MTVSNLPKNRQDAKKFKINKYFTNRYCQNNHLSARYTSSGKCIECCKNTWDKWDAKNKEKRISSQKKYWEIDHIKPISLCSSFQETWELSNLQPLEKSINRSKRNSYIG